MISLLFHSELCSLDDHCGPLNQLFQGGPEICSVLKNVGRRNIVG